MNFHIKTYERTSSFYCVCAPRNDFTNNIASIYIKRFAIVKLLLNKEINSLKKSLNLYKLKRIRSFKAVVSHNKEKTKEYYENENKYRAENNLGFDKILRALVFKILKTQANKKEIIYHRNYIQTF